MRNAACKFMRSSNSVGSSCEDGGVFKSKSGV